MHSIANCQLMESIYAAGSNTEVLAYQRPSCAKILSIAKLVELAVISREHPPYAACSSQFCSCKGADGVNWQLGLERFISLQSP